MARNLSSPWINLILNHKITFKFKIQQNLKVYLNQFIRRDLNATFAGYGLPLLIAPEPEFFVSIFEGLPR